MIKVITFDVGGVLVTHSPKRHSKKFSDKFKVPEKSISVSWKKYLTPAHTGKISTQQFYNEISKQIEKDCGKKISGKTLNEFNVSTLKPVRETLNLAGKLKKKYKTLILSNVADFFPTINKKHKLTQNFHASILSYKIGHQKPCKEIYLHLIKKAKCLPEEIFFTDDLVQYVNGAKKLGIHAVRFKTYEKLIKDLKKAGVTWK
ncbi:MAG: HAD hydrolase-like protein [Candidatus Diapherotrites archaeon]|nr:HAD hydrolase-like protein [Candidatus Diapherotrites archaeon]